MFAKYRQLVSVVLAVGLVGLLGYLCYDYGATTTQQRWDQQRAQALTETSAALTLLATRNAIAEAKYVQERKRKQTAQVRTVERVVHEIRNLPVRDCPVREPARRLLLDTFCTFARNATHPECVPRDVSGESTTSTKRGS